MAEINLVSRYGYRNIEGADIGDIARGIQGTSDIFKRDENNYTILIHKPTGRRIVLECVKSYFEPDKDYYKLHSKATCDFTRRALGINIMYNCDSCFLACCRKGLKIKQSKFRMADDYYRK